MAEINAPDFIASKEIIDELMQINAALLEVVKTGKTLGTAIKGAENIREVKDETTKLSAAQTELQKLEKQIATVQAKNNDEYIKQKRTLDSLNTSLKQKTALGDKDARQINEQNASVKELNAALQKNRDAYRSLATAEERASKEGQELKAIIDAQDKSVKKLNGQLGDFRDNVGDYEGSIGRAGKSFQQIAPGAAAAAQGIWGMVKAAIAFIATPIGIIVAALGAALYALTSYFKGSEEGQNRLNKIVAVGSAIFEQFMNVVESLGEALFDAFTNPKQAIKDFGNFLYDNVVNRLVGMLELIPKLSQATVLLFQGKFKQAGQVAFDAVAKVAVGVEDATNKISGLIDQTSKLVDQGVAYGLKIAALEAEIDRTERKMIVDRAKTNLEVAKLREEAITLEGDAKRAAINEAIALETKLSNEEVRFAKLRLQLAELKRDANGDDKDALKEVAEAQAAVTDAEKLRYDNTVKFRKQIEALDEEDAKKRTAFYNSIREKVTKTGDHIQDTFKKPVPPTLFANIETGIQHITDTARFKFNQTVEGLKESLEKAKEIWGDFASVTGSLLDSLTERRIQRIDQEERRLDEQTQNRIKAAGDNEAAVARIEADAELRRQQLEKKRIAAQRKAAIFDKATAIIMAGINTALAITKTISELGLPAAIPFVALTAALGAVQTAAIIAKPIPQFFKGTDSAPGGLAYVGERGAELMRKPGHPFELTPSVATIMDVPRGTEIIPHDQTMRMLAMGALQQNGGSQQVGGHDAELLQEVRKLNATIGKLKHPVQPSLARSGMVLLNAVKEKEAHTQLIRGINLGKWF